MIIYRHSFFRLHSGWYEFPYENKTQGDTETGNENRTFKRCSWSRAIVNATMNATGVLIIWPFNRISATRERAHVRVEQQTTVMVTAIIIVTVHLYNAVFTHLGNRGNRNTSGDK